MVRSRTVREGSVGLFALIGLILFGGLAIWVRQGGFGQKGYQIIVGFSDASGVQIGSPVRYRGVDVGRIVDLKPGTNGVDVTIEIASPELRIPRDVTIQTSRYGLIGESSIDITPLSSLPPEAQSTSPVSPDCNPKKIICSNERLEGDSGVELIASLTRLAQFYGDPKFFNNINSAAANASVATLKLAKLSDELAGLSKSFGKNIQNLPLAINSISGAANTTSSQVARVGNEFSVTNREISRLASNANDLLTRNRGSLSNTLTSINRTSEELSNVAASFNTTANRVNASLDSVDTKTIVQNLEKLSANANEASVNLRDLSKNLNSPTTLLTLQQTLDSARVTFENTQKITSDLDELTGDPDFRNNLLKLVNGLSSLVSSTQQLEQQIQTAQKLEMVTQVLEQQTQMNQSLEQKVKEQEKLKEIKDKTDNRNNSLLSKPK